MRARRQVDESHGACTSGAGAAIWDHGATVDGPTHRMPLSLPSAVPRGNRSLRTVAFGALLLALAPAVPAGGPPCPRVQPTARDAYAGAVLARFKTELARQRAAGEPRGVR